MLLINVKILKFLTIFLIFFSKKLDVNGNICEILNK